MKRKFGLFVVFTAFFTPPHAHAYAGNLTLDDALRATYTACVGIDDELSDLKKMAGINTAVTAVGTAAGAGAIATGFAKEKTDKKIDEILTKLKAAEKARLENGDKELSNEEKERIIAAVSVNNTAGVGDNNSVAQLQEKSKNLGNWRTGLLATNAATNIAGAAIAGTNKVDKELDAQIRDCVSAVNNLRASMMQAQLDGVDITEARTIADACDDYATVDTTKINKRATGAMISSAVGAATGVAGTVTSAMANSDKVRVVRAEDGGRTDKEKNLNTAANALSIGATVASVSATVFNAAQIAAIKKVASVSEKCTGVLK